MLKVSIHVELCRKCGYCEDGRPAIERASTKCSTDLVSSCTQAIDVAIWCALGHSRVAQRTTLICAIRRPREHCSSAVYIGPPTRSLADGHSCHIAYTLGDCDVDIAEPLNPARDDVARYDCADSRGSAGHDQISRLQRDRLR